MMLIKSNRRNIFVISIAAFCVLLASSTKVQAGPAAEPDFSSVTVPPNPRSAEQQIQLADDYLAGHGRAQDPKLAAYWYEKAAGAGEPRAQLQIGYLYATGIGVSKDPARAVHWYQLAASNGMLRAKVNLGIAYLWGAGVVKNERLAMQLLAEAAEKGSGLAACYLGDFYAFGVGAPQNQALAEQWYRRGAALHDPLAEFDLATLLFDGKEHFHDLHAAAKLLRDSAAAGYVPAMHSLGLLLVRNPGLATYPGEAAAVLTDSANAGNWRSSVLLGVLARDGNGVPADSNAAYCHFRVAVLQGGDKAKKLLDTDLRILSARLGDGEAQTIDSQANDWCRQHHFVLEFVDNMGEGQTGHPALALAFPEDGAHAARLLTWPRNEP